MFGAILFHGGLFLPQIIQTTKLSRDQVKKSLSSLNQQHLVLWYGHEDGGRARFEANIIGAYALVRCGKYARVVADHLGALAAGIVSDILLLGHIRVSDLVQSYCPSDTTGPMEEVLGRDAEPKPTLTVESIRSIIGNLLVDGLLSFVHESDFRSLADNKSEAESKIPKDIHAKSERQKDIEQKAAIARKLEEWKRYSEGEVEVFKQTIKGTKRSLEETVDVHRDKRTKLPERELDEAQDQTQLSQSPLDRLDV